MEESNQEVFKVVCLGRSGGKHHENTLYTFDPLKPHFYIVNLGFTEVNIIFLISVQKYEKNIKLFI